MFRVRHHPVPTEGPGGAAQQVPGGQAEADHGARDRDQLPQVRRQRGGEAHQGGHEEGQRVHAAGGGCRGRGRDKAFCLPRLTRNKTSMSHLLDRGNF